MQRSKGSCVTVPWLNRIGLALCQRVVLAHDSLPNEQMAYELVLSVNGPPPMYQPWIGRAKQLVTESYWTLFCHPVLLTGRHMR